MSIWHIMQQELESEFNAQADYLSEAYGPTARDAALFADTEVCEGCEHIYRECNCGPFVGPPTREDAALMAEWS
jgi:hypothetical protein